MNVGLEIEGVINTDKVKIARGGYHGLYIEFKAKTNKPSEDQRIIMLMLDDYGFCIKAKYFEKSIDIFWPESPYGEYNEPVII